jgi:hypothetical protein
MKRNEMQNAMTTAEPVDFEMINPAGIPHIGMRQIEIEYELSRARAHRLIKKSGLEPYTWFNKHFYAEPAVRQYFEGLFLPRRVQ